MNQLKFCSALCPSAKQTSAEMTRQFIKTIEEVEATFETELDK